MPLNTQDLSMIWLWHLENTSDIFSLIPKMATAAPSYASFTRQCLIVWEIQSCLQVFSLFIRDEPLFRSFQEYFSSVPISLDHRHITKRVRNWIDITTDYLKILMILPLRLNKLLLDTSDELELSYQEEYGE